MDKTTGVAPATATQGPHEARGVRGAVGKAGTAQQQGQAGAQGGGFAQLLAAVGGDESVDLFGAPGGDPGEGAGDLPCGAGATALSQVGTPDATALAAWMAVLQPGATLAQAGDVDVAEGKIVATGGIAAIATDGATGGVAGGVAGVVAGGAMAGETDALAIRVGLGLVRQGRDSLVGQTALLDGQAEAAALSGAPQPLAVGVGMARTPHAGSALAAQGTSEAGEGHPALRAGGDSVHRQLEPDAAQPPSVAQTASAAPAERHDALTASAAVPPRPGAEPLTAQPVAAATAEVAADVLPAAGRDGESPSAGAAGMPALERHAPDVPDAAQPTADATPSGMGSAEEQLAEQVAYWVHHKTQSAELTLDQGGSPVEVKVSLTGDEAQVSFRSDQAEARQLLDTSSAELRAMLQREGLQLAGVTVGTAGGEGAPARQGAREGGRQQARRAAVQAAAPAGSARGMGGQSVDIFV